MEEVIDRRGNDDGVMALVRLNGFIVGERELRRVDRASWMDGDIFRCHILGGLDIANGQKAMIEFKDGSDFFASGRVESFANGRLTVVCDFYSDWFSDHWDYDSDMQRSSLEMQLRRKGAVTGRR